MFYNTVWAWKWQLRRKVEKEAMLQERIEKLSLAPMSIQNAQTDIPINWITKSASEKDWPYKPVTIKGNFDHENEFLVQRTVKGERGLEVVTPLFTGVDG